VSEWFSWEQVWTTRGEDSGVLCAAESDDGLEEVEVVRHWFCCFVGVPSVLLLTEYPDLPILLEEAREREKDNMSCVCNRDGVGSALGLRPLSDPQT